MIIRSLTRLLILRINTVLSRRLSTLRICIVLGRYRFILVDSPFLYLIMQLPLPKTIVLVQYVHQ